MACVDMNYHSTMTSRGYCYCYRNHYHYSKSKRVVDFGSHDPKYYDQIITKLNLQPRDRQKYEHSLLHNQGARTSNRGKKKKKRVLLIDDERDICMIYQMVLEDAGYECISYTDPVSALQEFRIDHYDLILLDIKMPVLNGFELCKKIREIDRAVHIVFITASEHYYEQFRTQHYPELGKVNYIQKPIGNDELVRIVNTIVGNSITVE
jgi:CheY-like chemotaxis protein